MLSQTYLPKDVVRRAFLYAEEANVACCGFLGDKNVTMRSHPRLDELHERYFEPQSYVASSIEEIVEQNVYKILFYGDDEEVINSTVKPYWEINAVEGARITRAIPEMLELVPEGKDLVPTFASIYSYDCVMAGLTRALSCFNLCPLPQVQARPRDWSSS